MMTAEQLEKEWMAQDKILDFRNWLVAQLIESRGKVATLLTIAKNDAFAAAQLAEKEREIERLENKCDLMIRQDREEVWYWADDGEDHPESLACPALIKPDVVRRFVAAEQRLQEVQAQLDALKELLTDMELEHSATLRQREAELEKMKREE